VTSIASLKPLLWAVVGLGVIALAPPLVAASPPPDPTVIRGSLDNGLTYFIRPTEDAAEPAEFRLVVDAGSTVEADDQRGVAHLIEHLGFRSTTNYPDGNLIAQLQALGADFGPHINAFTSFDETVFKLSLDATDPHNLETGVSVLREWAGNIVFAPESVDAEREVVAAEWSTRLGPNQRLLRQALAHLYPGSRYADRLPIGDLPSLQSVPLDRIAAFYRQWYRPDNMAVIVSGPVDPTAMANAIQTHFGDFANPPHPLEKPDSNLPVEPGIIPSVATDPELGYNVVRLIFPHDRIAATDADALRQRVRIKVVATILTERLEHRKESPPSPFLLGRANYGKSFVRAQEELTLMALVADGAAEAGLTALIEACERLLRFGATPDEVSRAKANLQSVADTTLAESEKKPANVWADTLVAAWLNREPVADPTWTHAQISAALDSITPEQLAKTAKGLLFPARSLVRLDLAKKPGNPPPDPEEILQLITKLRAAPMTASVAVAASPTSLLPEPPTPGSVVSRREISSIGITELQLNNGTTVILKPTDFTAAEILFSAQRPGGFLALPAELELGAKFAPGYITEAGWGELRKSDLIRLLSGKQAAVSVQFEPYLDLIKGQTIEADLETALQLIHLAFKPLRSDQGAFETVLGMNHAFESNVVMNPLMAFFNEVMIRRHDQHPRAPRLIQPPRAWNELNLDGVTSAYHHRMSDAAGFTFFFVGSFKEPDITPLLEQYLGSLPGAAHATPGRHWPDVGIRQIEGPVHEVIPGGHDPKSVLVFTQQHAVASWTPRETHLLWSLGNILQRALLDQLRIEQNNVYTLQVNSALERIPFDHYLAEIVIPCRPGDEASIAEGLQSQIERLRIEGPSAEELQQEIEFQRAKQRRESTSNSDWLWKLELIHKYDESYQRLANPNALIDWLTPDALREVAQTHLHPDRWVRYDLRPSE